MLLVSPAPTWFFWDQGQSFHCPLCSRLIPRLQAQSRSHGKTVKGLITRGQLARPLGSLSPSVSLPSQNPLAWHLTVFLSALGDSWESPGAREGLSPWVPPQSLTQRRLYRMSEWHVCLTQKHLLTCSPAQDPAMPIRAAPITRLRAVKALH